MHMISSTARRPNASTRSEPVERCRALELGVDYGACKDKELGA